MNLLARSLVAVGALLLAGALICLSFPGSDTFDASETMSMLLVGALGLAVVVFALVVTGLGGSQATAGALGYLLYLAVAAGAFRVIEVAIRAVLRQLKRPRQFRPCYCRSSQFSLE